MWVIRELWRDLGTSGYGHGSNGKGGGWAGLQQVLYLRTTIEYLEQPGKPPSIEDHFYITNCPLSLPSGQPETLLQTIRGHWGIENRLHHVKDRSMREDDQTARRGASLLGRLRSLVVGLYAYVEGASTKLKELTIQANPMTALRLLLRIRFPKNGRVLL